MLNLLRSDLYRMTRIRGLRGELWQYASVLLFISCLEVGLTWFILQSGMGPAENVNLIKELATPSSFLGSTMLGSFSVLALAASFGMVEYTLPDLSEGYVKSLVSSPRGRALYLGEKILLAGIWSALMLALGCIFHLVILKVFLTIRLCHPGAGQPARLRPLASRRMACNLGNHGHRHDRRSDLPQKAPRLYLRVRPYQRPIPAYAQRARVLVWRHALLPATHRPRAHQHSHLDAQLRTAGVLQRRQHHVRYRDNPAAYRRRARLGMGRSHRRHLDSHRKRGLHRHQQTPRPVTTAPVPRGNAARTPQPAPPHL